MHVKKGDTVVVISGNDKGKVGEVRTKQVIAKTRPRHHRRRQRALEAQEADAAKPQGRARPTRVLDPREQRHALGCQGLEARQADRKPSR